MVRLNSERLSSWCRFRCWVTPREYLMYRMGASEALKVKNAVLVSADLQHIYQCPLHVKPRTCKKTAGDFISNIC